MEDMEDKPLIRRDSYSIQGVVNGYGSTQLQDPAFLKVESEEDSGRKSNESSGKFSEAEEVKPSSRNDLLYGVNDDPPAYICAFLGLQQYLTMFGSTLSAPFLLCPAMCIATNDPIRADFLSTIMFVSGLGTLLQSTFGVRLPIVQGSSMAFLVCSLSILKLPQWACTTLPLNVTAANATNSTPLASNVSAIIDPWQPRMLELQGAIVLASLFQIFLGLTGLIGTLMKYITPLTITPVVTLTGLSLFEQAAILASENFSISVPGIVLVIICSQYLKNVSLPYPTYSRKGGFKFGRLPVFALFPVLLAVIIMWGVCALLTYFNVFSETNLARTDLKNDIIHNSPWVRVPYPGQWGAPTVSVTAVVGMFAGAIACVIESVGDYYSCARLCGEPAPPTHAVNRGVVVEGISTLLSGLFGTGTGTTSFAENIGAIGVTKVGSRSVIQMAGLIMILMGVITKCGALFMTIPDPIVGALYTVVFGLVVAVGISNVIFIDLNSSRNLFILGFSIFFGLSISKWIEENPGAINTGNAVLDNVLTVLLSTSMLLGGVLGCLLDNTAPGSLEERGLLKWGEVSKSCDSGRCITYDLPWITGWVENHSFFKYIPFCPTYKQRSSSRPKHDV